MILLWDVDSGLAQIDKYLHSNDNHVVAGALLGVGIVNCGVKNDCDPVSYLLCVPTGAVISLFDYTYLLWNFTICLFFSRHWHFLLTLLIKRTLSFELGQFWALALHMLVRTKMR